MSAASRPSIALSGAVLIPFFIGLLLRKSESVSFKIWQVISFSVPLIIGVIIIMWYNNERFGSVFDFGKVYIYS